MAMAEVDVDELEKLLEQGATLVDVRELDEWADAAVKGAIHRPLATVPDIVDELTTGFPIFVMCAKGGRSAKAVKFLCTRGVEAINVTGGIEAWIDAGKPTAPGDAS